MTYFFQSFLRVSRLGVIISLLIYCIFGFIYLPMYSPMVNSILRYIICILFPPTNLLLGLNSFFAFERQFSPLNNRITLDVAEVNISFMIIFFIVSFFLYIILGFSITNICFGDKVYKKNNKINEEDSHENSSSSINSNDMTDIISEKEKTKSEEPSSISYNINKSKKFGNPPKFDNIGLGERYIESDEEEDNDNNINDVNDKDNNVNNKKNNDNDDMDIKLQYMNCIESKAKNQADDLSKKKFNNLRRTIMKNKGLKDSLDIYKNNKNNPNSKEINDEIEYDLDNQIEVQKIRNERRKNK